MKQLKNNLENYFRNKRKSTLTDNRDEKVSIGNLGTFKVKHVPERSGVAALAGGKEWTKPAHDEICFKISKSVKELS